MGVGSQADLGEACSQQEVVLEDFHEQAARSRGGDEVRPRSLQKDRDLLAP